MKWCCAGFQAQVQFAGERGMAVIVDTSPEAEPVFVLQHRVVDVGTESGISARVPASIVTEIQIQYCPWCGAALHDFYGESVKKFARSDLRVKLDPGDSR